ncbi:MAG TPA: carbamoyltransferase HypF, partial [Solirubrobacteraceae bacterium]|nr:carbamoyltransferase HypF [Solirubrobacteraceae bacterium]
GDRAIREPWRMACAWLQEALGEEPPLPPRLAASVDASRWRAVASVARSGLAAPVTTSMGRLFDAVAALAGLRAQVTYEGQAAADLEAAATGPNAAPPYPLPVDPGPPVLLDARRAILAAARDAAEGVGAPAIAARFHAAVVAATARACAILAERHGLGTIVLSGGVFQNRLLLDATAALLEREGLRALVPERLPPNDGGISYGQAAVAAAGMRG